MDAGSSAAPEYNPDDIRQIVQEEGRNARNLLNWSVPMHEEDYNRSNAHEKPLGVSSPMRSMNPLLASPIRSTPGSELGVAPPSPSGLFHTPRMRNKTIAFTLGKIHQLLTDVYTMPNEVDSSDEKEIAAILLKCQTSLEILKRRLIEESVLPNGIKLSASHAMAPGHQDLFSKSLSASLLLSSGVSSRAKTPDPLEAHILEKENLEAHPDVPIPTPADVQPGGGSPGPPNNAKSAVTPHKILVEVPILELQGAVQASPQPRAPLKAPLRFGSKSAERFRAKNAEPSAEDLRRSQLTRLAKAEESREQLLLEKMEKIRTKETARLKEATERVLEKRAQLQQQLSDKMEKAEQLRENRIKEVVRKAKEEEQKVGEVAFINTLNTDDKVLAFHEKKKEAEEALVTLEEQRTKKGKQKMEEHTAKERAVQEKRKTLEAEKVAKFETMEQKRKDHEKNRESEKQKALELKEAKRQKLLEEMTHRAELSEHEIFTLTAPAKQKADEFAGIILGALHTDDKFSWEKKRSTQPKKSHTGSRMRTLFQTLETMNSRLSGNDVGYLNPKHDFEKINELVDSVLDSWKDKAENFLIAEIEEIYTTKDWRTLLLFCQYMGTSHAIPARTIQLLFTFINLVCKLASFREVLLFYSLNGIPAWVAFVNALDFQLSQMLDCNFERSEAAAKIFALLIVLISDETWQEQVTTESQSRVLRTNMISYAFNLNLIEKVDYILAQLRDKRDYDHFIVNSLSLLTEFIDVLHSNRNQLLVGPKESNFLLNTIIPGLKKTNVLGILALLDETLLRSGPLQKKGFNSPRPDKEFTKIASQGLDFVNNIALLDLEALQEMLGAEDLSIQLVHFLVSTIISVGSVYWRREAEVDYTPALMAQLLQVVTHFALRNKANQDRLRMDACSVIVNLARLPFHFFLHKIYRDQLFPTIIAACYENDINLSLVAEDLDLSWIAKYIEQQKSDRLNALKDKEKGAVAFPILPTDDFDALYLYFSQRMVPPRMVRKEDAHKDEKERRWRSENSENSDEKPPPSTLMSSAQVPTQSAEEDPQDQFDAEPQVPLPFEDPQLSGEQ